MRDERGRRELALSGAIWVPVWFAKGRCTTFHVAAGVHQRHPWLAIAFETLEAGCRWVDGELTWRVRDEPRPGDPR